MLHEAFYPSVGGAKEAVRVLYGFVNEYESLTLVVFYPKLTGTSLFNLDEETQSEFVLFLLEKHVYGVLADFVKVAFVCSHVSEGNFYGELYGVDVRDAYFKEAHEEYKERINKKYGRILGGFFLSRPYELSTNTRNLTIGSTSSIRLIPEGNIAFDRTKEIIKSLKLTELGDFEPLLGENRGGQDV
ncbi:hypothetical protein R4576_18090 [Acinetobacter baumannii]|nr:hypothetical protein [Acinetobacter baumannii]